MFVRLRSRRALGLSAFAVAVALGACGSDGSDPEVQPPGNDSGVATGSSGYSGSSGSSAEGGVPCAHPPGPPAEAQSIPLQSALIDATKTGWSSSSKSPATASLEFDAGASALRLHYDLHCDGNSCGDYVFATWKPAPAIAAAGLRIRARFVDAAALIVRIVDETGQTLQYFAWRTAGTAEDEIATYRIMFDEHAEEPGFPYAQTHTGGANDGTVHGAIKSVSLGVYAAFASSVQADLDVSELSLLAADAPATAVDVDVFAPDFHLLADAAETAATQVGISAHLGRANDDAEARRILDATVDLGFDLVRTEFSWKSIEGQTKGTYDRSRIVEERSKIAAAGLRAWTVLDYGNPLYDPDPSQNPAPNGLSPKSEASRTAFANYAKLVVDAVGSNGLGFEIWNEPNGPAFWKPTPNPADYGALCTSTAAAVKPTLADGQRVTTAGFANSWALYAYWATAAEGGCLADQTSQKPTDFAFHPYRTTPETWPAQLKQWRHVLPAGTRIYDTEWGYTSTKPHHQGTVDGHSEENRHQQAISLARRAIVSLAVGLPMTSFYDLRDDGQDAMNPEHNFGLLGQDFTPKPSALAVQKVLLLRKSHPFTGWVDRFDGRVHAARFESETEAVLAVWTHVWTNGTPPIYDVVLRCDGIISAHDLVGAPLQVTKVSDRCSVSITEQTGPVYVTYAKSCQP